jgi:hypothetical protein
MGSLLMFVAHHADGGVIVNNITAMETDDVQMACHPTDLYRPTWIVHSDFQRETLGRAGEFRIYHKDGFTVPFEETGRYSLREGQHFYNLTISRVNLSETGEYICHERFEKGRKTSLQLFVLGEIQYL